MRKVLAVVRREFIERVRQKWFWVMALVGPLFFAAIILLPQLMIRGGGIKKIAVVDGTTQGFGPRVAAALDTAVTPDGHRVFQVARVPAGPGVIDSLTKQVEAKRLEGFLIVSDGIVDSGRAEYQASNVSSFTAVETIQRNLTQIVFSIRLERQGVNPVLVTKARLPIALATQKIAGGKATRESAAQGFSLAYFMAIILYTSILIYGINVMSSVLEEKTNRVVEVLVSSLRPFQLMLGKLIGVGAVSIFQFLLWALSARYLLARRGGGGGSAPQAGQVFEIPHVSLETALVFAAYFLGGFFLYSAMFAAVGAISSTEQEARQGQQPVSVLLMVSFFAMFAMINDPNSTLAVTLSLIPFCSPIAMPVRWAAGNLPISEVAVSLAILLAAIVLVTWVASRIYRVGILATGKRPSLTELVRWVRTS